ncbi:MAG TPA: glycosyltransferase, partial [Bacteroidota bacterium]|nr:glycosyltransferase [Bacteroidota bacterium]
ALRSLKKASAGIRSEIIVVDNASVDGSLGMLRTHFPGVRVIALDDNLGFAKANNMALRSARGKYCLLINPDTLVQEDTLRVVINFFESHGDVGLAGCKILNPDGSFQMACRRSFPTPWVAFTKIFGLAALFPHSKLFGRYNQTYRSAEESYEVDAVSGSFMMIRRRVFEEVGGLDEDFFMYGEDLDWCYRIKQKGWKVYYLHDTSIIHYKGESTRRSGLNEIRTFYEAMHLFVQKHYGRTSLLAWSLKAGISLTAKIALVRMLLRPMNYALVDLLLVPLSMLLAEFVWRGNVFLYPSYAYPIVFVIPAITVVGAMYAFGVYTNRRMSVSRSLMAVFSSYLVISSLVAFFKEYAFSRMIVVISGALCAILIPGWRLILRSMGKVRVEGRRSVIGRKTLIVGTHKPAQQLLKKLRTFVAGDYEVIGFVDETMERIGKQIDGIPIVGGLENIGKMVRQYHVSDVIVSPQSVSYADILSMIGKTREQSVTFHMVPSTMEVILGKGSIDSLSEVPLVEISYNIDQPFHRFNKRLFDLVASCLLFIGVYPILWLTGRTRRTHGPGFFARLPLVIRGSMSLVGPSEEQSGPLHPNLHTGKPGLAGMVQLQENRPLNWEDVDRLNLYYARNQSLVLDLEILIKTWLEYRSRRKSNR